MKVLYLIPTLIIIAGLGAVGALAITRYSQSSTEEGEKLVRLEKMLNEKNMDLNQLVTGKKSLSVSSNSQ